MRIGCRWPVDLIALMRLATRKRNLVRYKSRWNGDPEARMYILSVKTVYSVYAQLENS